MQKTLLFFLFALASLLGVQAESWTAENVPIPYLKDATKYVSDPENILQASSRATLTISSTWKKTRACKPWWWS